MTGPDATSRATGLPPGGLLALLLLLTAIRLSVAGLTGLIDDEAYYRLWSLHPTTGYLDHAPMVAWVIAAGRAIAGEGSLGVRLLAPIGTLAGSLLLWRTVALFEGRATATRAVVWFNAMILVGAGSVLMTPDGPSVFFWGATVWALAELTASRNANWWLVVGVAAGLGLLSKYSVLFLGIGIVLWLISTRETRRWFLTPQLFLGGAIAGLLFLPVVLWNAEHRWMSFAKQFGRTSVSEWRPELVGELVGVQLLLIGLPMVPFVGLGVARFLARRDAAGLLPIATSLPFVAYLLFHALHARVEGNWPAPLYPTLAWAAAVGASTPLGLADRWAGRLSKLRGVVAPFGYGVTALLYLHVLVPLVVLPPNRDPTAQMKGWGDFTRDLAALGEQVGAPVFGGRNYTLSAQLAAGLGARRIAPFDERERYLDLPVLDPRRVCAPILYVERDGHGAEPDLGGHWRSVVSLGTLPRGAGGRVIENHPIWRLADPIDCTP